MSSKLDRIVFGEQVQIEVEQLRDRFEPVEGSQQQHVFAQRGRDRDADAVPARMAI